MNIPLPKVSILIPVYNRKDYIADCIQSALDQTISDFEIVIVDNASDDGTWSICQQFAENDSRIRIFRNEHNIGPVRNWIRCAQEARGELSKMLFSDDSLEPDCVRRMIEPLTNKDVGFVFCAASVGESKESSSIHNLFRKNCLIEKNRYVSLLISGRVPVSPGAIILRTRDLLKNLHSNFPTATPRPFDRHGAGPDVMISLLTASSYPSVACICDPLVFFRVHTGSFTVSNANNEVADGYISAISFYLRYNESRFLWMQYLVRSWLSEVRRQGYLSNPKTFLRANEGRGSLLEMLAGLALIPYCVVSKVVARVRDKFDRTTS